MGGAERLERLRAAGRLDARARVAGLLDDGTFAEIGQLAGALDGPGAAADALVAGYGEIDGRPVLVGSEDATVLGGSIGLAGAAKRERLARLAGQERIPLIMLLDGAGHRVSVPLADGSMPRTRPAPTDLAALADLAGRVPVLVGVMGASAGHGALCAPLADVIVMVEGQGQLFTAGPPIVRASTGEHVDKEALGGWHVAGRSGLAHLAAADDLAALDLLREVFGYLPLNAWASPPSLRPVGTSHPRRPLGELIEPDLMRPYDIGPVIEELFDADSVIELQELYGPSVVCALARLGGEAVAVVANQPAVAAGAIDVAGADKASRFIEFAGSFHLPLVLLADNPGVLPGSASERAGILRHAARMFAAQHRHPGPKMHVTLRKAFGFGSSIMGQNPFSGQTITLALPTATLGAMPARGGAGAAKLDSGAADGLAEQESSGPWRFADTLAYDDIVAPDELRARLTAVLRAALAGRATAAPEPRSRIGHLP